MATSLTLAEQGPRVASNGSRGLTGESRKPAPGRPTPPTSALSALPLALYPWLAPPLQIGRPVFNDDTISQVGLLDEASPRTYATALWRPLL